MGPKPLFHLVSAPFFRGNNMLSYIYVAYLIIVIAFSIFMIWFMIEGGITFFFRIPPQLPSQRQLRNAAVEQIRANYHNMRTVIDIGSGWGGLCRRVAREFPNMRVTGVELMPLTFIWSRVAKAILGPRNCRFVFGDVIKYLMSSRTPRSGDPGSGRNRGLDNVQNNEYFDAPKGNRVPHNFASQNLRDDTMFDIAVCYSGTSLMAAIAPLAGQFRVIVSIDFPLPDRAPARTVELHKDRLGQHVLYVYEAPGTGH